MKKSQSIIGLPVISIDEAAQLGKVKEILIDPCEGKARYLLIMDEKWYLGAKLIEFDKVISFGDDAIIIQTEKNLAKFCDVDDAIKLAEKNIRIIDSKAFTERGQYIGIIKEYYIREKEGTISGCLLEGANGTFMLESPQIVSFGARTLVLDGTFEDKTGSSQSPDHTLTQSDSTRLFEEKQRQFLIGRKAKRQILDDMGEVLLEEGQLVTKEILDRVKDKNKIIELTINTR